jgi:hypothetical protein
MAKERAAVHDKSEPIDAAVLMVDICGKHNDRILRLVAEWPIRGG